jgi:UDP-N-acetylmuramyl pentapeptide synthase
MTLGLSKRRLSEIVGGSPITSTEEDARLVFRGVQFDSREVRGGELFLALKGAQQHGHEFVAGVFDRGAALALVEDRDRFANAPFKNRLVYVSDTLEAFSALAQWWRRELNIPIFAITGSVGKTTVKEMAAHILLGVSPGAYSQRSFNNHVGVPYTLCGMTQDHRWAVVEMGMSHAGEISRITRIAEPDHVGITCISYAHIENFDSLSGIADAKFEILEGLRPGGALVLRAGDQELEAGLRRHGSRVNHAVWWVGDGEQCAAQVSNIKSHGFDGVSFNLALRGPALREPGGLKCSSETKAAEQVRVSMGLLGSQNAYNAAIAAVIARLLAPEIPLNVIAERLESFVAPAMRLRTSRYNPLGRRSGHAGQLTRQPERQTHRMTHNHARDRAEEAPADQRGASRWGGPRQDVWVIDDSYNANPASMGAFLDIAGDLIGSGHRVGLIMGDMLELGVRGPELHRIIGDQLARLSPVVVATVGPLASGYVHRLSESKGDRFLVAESPEQAAEWLMRQECNVFMVKGSRGIQLDRAARMINTHWAEHAQELP